MDHLNSKLIEFVRKASDQERIESIRQSHWIGYPVAKSILKGLNDLLNYPQVHRMPNLLLVGDSNNGKTALLNQFGQYHQSFLNKETGELIVPVVLIQSPPEPDEKRFYNSILETLYAPYKTSENAERRQQRVIHLLRKLNTKLLIIDEIHHILAGTIGKQRTFLNVIKYLSNELRISIVGAGTKDAFNAIQTDPQLANRFIPKVLPKWTNDEDFLRLLLSFETALPLKKPSNLIEGSLSQKILYMSEGLIGEISAILELASILAIESKIEKINSNVLDNIIYIRPSDRKKMIHRL
ncbi:TniB family NTP-binding protein [Marinigracilibium pacificum]|uniref:AAA family ATPase n=1 Tax=Marinigracilibium pacificum TaxID=2729599 RepID=A0A848J485_9BACT|nr:TniB family NTP-binding protein [Marinigracilibium pacificum]NMM50315.1 AAA family ATPase [Marinigracilibium pacificum]